MKVYPVQMNNLAVKAPNFQAFFIHNEISRDLIDASSQNDVVEFNKVCEELKQAKRDDRNFLLAGVTSGYGVCAETEVDDKFIDLSYKTLSSKTPNFLKSWMIKTENIVSGGYEKQNLLKEITKTLRGIATENAFHPPYSISDIIVKKAISVGKVI